ncbi:ribonuclease H [Sinomonas cellulolyticus]|uniref:Ribonuclease H n=1 Tax=Sinomonas cellulolyticus TaxID=2801916 RepID=A0ABS1K034_9MICC|nr:MULTISPECIES: ribonuclease HI family protein [Sinomonas]MBL0705019.1 ribonuclease HI family protein [Sinomonas cellulolyticus]GHG53796.1 ribonuclease H [Sinomonas sp. KCTC 49339]
MTITAAADGSALGNPGPAGWAWYVDEDHWHAGGWPHGTNNQGELMAVLDLFRSTVHMADESLRILCDSQYVINCITKWMPGWKRKGWKKADGKPVLNVDLLKQIDAELSGRRYTFEWVKGHAGHELNEAADSKARAVALAFQSGRAPVEGPGYPAPAAGTERAAARARDERDAPEPAREAEQAGLFDEIVHEEPVSAATRDVEAVVELEQELLSPAVRGDYGQLAYLLHPQYREIGASGRLWEREELIEELVQGPEIQTRFELVDATPLAGDLVQVVYRTAGSSGSSLRSSLWQREEGRWRLRFHQGTPEA